MSITSQQPSTVDARALAAIGWVEQHGAVLGQVCMALLGSQTEAEEALQQTFLAALDVGPSCGSDDARRAWLLGIARRVCAQRSERGSRNRETSRTAPNGGASDEVSASPERHARRLLAELRPTEREALVLRFTGGLGLRELAEACGVDVEVAARRASRGLARLRALLDEGQR